MYRALDIRLSCLQLNGTVIAVMLHQPFRKTYFSYANYVKETMASGTRIKNFVDPNTYDTCMKRSI